ncbi:MAG: hypothetical protein ABI767_04365 [Rhodanobacter sp.]
MELMQGSAVVIAKRTRAMAAAGVNPSAAHDREMKRMVDEKVIASTDSLASMALVATSAWQSMFLGPIFGGRTPSTTEVQRLATSVIKSGMEPYKKAVRSNVKRLRK